MKYVSLFLDYSFWRKPPALYAWWCFAPVGGHFSVCSVTEWSFTQLMRSDSSLGGVGISCSCHPFGGFSFPDSVTDKEQLSRLIKRLLLQHRETIPGSHSKASERNDCGVSSPRWHISQPTPAPEAQRTQRKQARKEFDSQRTREMAVSSCLLVRTGKLYWWNLNTWLPKQDQKDLNNSRHPSIVGGELRGFHTSMKSSKQSATAERGRIAFPREEYLVGQSVPRGQS